MRKGARGPGTWSVTWSPPSRRSSDAAGSRRPDRPDKASISNCFLPGASGAAALGRRPWPRPLPSGAGPATITGDTPGSIAGGVMTMIAPPRLEFMTDAVAHWAAVRPDAEALTYRDVRWTWAQWHDRIRRAADGLAALGLGRGGRVAFLDKNNPACLEVSLGAGLLGAACAVINWRLAAGELDYVINDCGASVLLVWRDLVD